MAIAAKFVDTLVLAVLRLLSNVLRVVIFKSVSLGAKLGTVFRISMKVLRCSIC